MAAAEIDRMAIARELFPDQPPGFPYADFDIHELRMPKDDDMGINSDDDDVNEEDVENETGFGSVIVVSNLPIAPQEKFDKLSTVVKKVLSSVGTIKEGGFIMPKDESDNTKGFAFVEFSTPQEAAFAKTQLNGYKLDKSHTLVTNMFDDFDKYAKVPDQYQPLEVKQFTPVENLHSWMLDKTGRDQFVLRADDETFVFWNDGKRGRCEMAYSRKFWTESFVQWSPLGNFITTLHRQGVAIWGGPGYARIQRYSHPNVRLLEFSPNENYMITYSSQDPQGPTSSTTHTFTVFDVRNGKKLRIFEGPADDFTNPRQAATGTPGALKWPVFKWSGGKQDKFFALMAKDAIKVYEAPEMVMLDKKPYILQGLYDFDWSPAEAILAAYIAEDNQMPARIALVRFPEKKEVRQKNLFSVSDVKIYWHPQGDYLAVKVDRYTKTKKTTYTGFELFSIRDKDIPMEVLELPNKNEKILTFAWEPKGHRFAVVHGDGPRPSVSFYTMRDEKGRLAVKLLGTITNKACNSIYWSPQGKFIILAGLKNLNGQLEFFSVDDMETMATAEHFMATDVDWDPTGRYVCTSITTIHQMENGFNLWSFNGRLLYAQTKDRLFQFSWRPRLPSSLPAEKEAELLKNLKSYSKRYEEEDEALLMQADADVLQDRQRLLDSWNQWASSKAEYKALLDGFKKEMYGPRYTEKEFTLEKASVEQVLDLKEEPYNAR